MGYARGGCVEVMAGALPVRACTHAQDFRAASLRAPITLRAMRQRIRADKADPRVWMVAREVATSTDSRDQRTQALAIRRWCADRFRYVRDPLQVELLTSPVAMLDQIARIGFMMGDCDEAAMLTAALLRGVGIRAELQAVSFAKDRPFSHVFSVAFPHGARQLEMDITRPAGASPPAQWPRRLRILA